MCVFRREKTDVAQAAFSDPGHGGTKLDDFYFVY